jgi:hypothetical protein
MEGQLLLAMRGSVVAFLPSVVWKASQCGWLKIGKTERGLDVWEKPTGELMVIRPGVEPLVPALRLRGCTQPRARISAPPWIRV